MKDNVAEATADGKPGFFGRVKQGLGRTRSHFVSGLETIFMGDKVIGPTMMEDIETTLLLADVGVEATQAIVDLLAGRVARKELNNLPALYESLKQQLEDLLRPCEVPLVINQMQTPFVILTVGVNGAGKTTTIGKMASYYQAQGKTVMLAAGDTFRAAAVEQLKVWGERNKVPVIAQEQGADSASVVYDALAAAKARHIDVLIADTAGRLQNKKNLMLELTKINRVLGNLEATAPHEVLLVLDAGTGQNAISQAKEFLAAVDVSGIVLTKLDGTARGGVIFAIAKQLGLPIRFIGVGEQIDDLRPFSAHQFVEALFDNKLFADQQPGDVS